ncbi:winged helix-turn-helix transcriptional regulator [Actinacidiphila rubida]|uniref:Transcriptional regulator, HxlR family n=1 Tax=Actinacidiphila rubida TaxID=310780 RepID=A0A1H8S5D9_9ACTN|nr:winged helix-turn-helix transcriptional regulator [Actinacidiphila rubida]SEO73900.1 transcriptional regulator, HxlR family [Actinacidiphila rubida]
MSKRPSSTTDLVVAAAELLGRQWTTRLTAELTDHGPVPIGLVAGTFSDLTHDQFSYGLRALRDRGLVAYGKDSGRDCYVLTDAGEGLGDVHDALSRWARKHHFPAEEGDFVTRVEAGLRLLRDRDLLTVLDTAGPDRASELDPEAERSLTDAGFMYVLRDGEPALTSAGQDLRGPLTALASWARAHASLLQRRTDTRPGLRATIPGPARTPAARRSA